MKRAPLFSLVASLLLIGCTETANPDAGHPSARPQDGGSAGTTTAADGSDGSSSSNGGKEGGAGSTGTTGAGGSTGAAGSTGTAGTTGAGGAGGGKGGEGGSKGGAGGSTTGEGGSKGGAGGGNGGAGGSGGVAGTAGLQVLTTFRVYDVVETAAGLIFASDGSHILQVSADKGATWNQVPGATFQVRPGALIVNALGEILAGTVASTPAVDYCTPTGCTNAPGITGAQTAMTGFSKDVGGSVYAINDASATIHHSTDHGHTWTAISGTMPVDIGQAYAIEVNAYGLMIGGEIGSALLSTDGGNTWTDFGLLRHSVRLPTDYNGNLWAIATDPVTKAVLATVEDPAATGTVQRHLPTDAAAVWHAATGLKGAAGEEVGGFVFQKDGSILAGAILRTPGTGEVYKSTDGGASWVEISSKIGVAFRGLVRLHIGPSGCLYISHGLGLLRNCSGY